MKNSLIYDIAENILISEGIKVEKKNYDIAGKAAVKINQSKKGWNIRIAKESIIITEMKRLEKHTCSIALYNQGIPETQKAFLLNEGKGKKLGNLIQIEFPNSEKISSCEIEEVTSKKIQDNMEIITFKLQT